MPATLFQLYPKMQQPSASQILNSPVAKPLPALGSQTMDCLLQLSQPQSGASSADHSLALELLSIVGGDGTPAEHATIQRINLVGQMFNQLLAEPYLPVNCRKLLEPLRYSMMKNALVDVGFLIQAQHPLRQILHNTLLNAITACTKGSNGLRQIESRMHELPMLVDLSATFVIPALPTMQPLTDEQVTLFGQQLAAQATERNQTLMTQIDRTVTRELDEMTLGLKLPPSVITFMRYGIVPLLSNIMMKHGMDSVRWTAEMSRVHSLLTSYEPANAARATDRSGLISNLILDLTSVGMPHDRIQKLISLLNTGGVIQKQDQRQEHTLDLSLHRI